MEVLQSPEFGQYYTEAAQKVERAANQLLDTEYEVLGIPGLEPRDEIMVRFGLFLAMDPKLIGFSQCQHRAVAASFCRELPTDFSDPEASALMKLMGSVGILGGVLDVHGQPWLFVTGYNNWNYQEAGVLLERGPANYCKSGVGAPWRLGPESTFDKETEVPNRAEVDLACARRRRGEGLCAITHAERDAWGKYMKIAEVFRLPQPERAFMTATWVPCTYCLQLIQSEKTSFGTNLGIFCGYGAFGEQDDENYAREVARLFPAGELQGPLAWIPKDAGYGWLPGDPGPFPAEQIEVNATSEEVLRVKTRLYADVLHLVNRTNTPQRL